MTHNPILAAKLHDIGVRRRMILCLVGREQSLSAKGFDPDENFEASCSRQQAEELLLLCDLRIALNEEGYANVLVDHLLKQFLRLAVLVEIVRSEHHQPNARGFRFSKTLDGRLRRLAPDLSSGN